MSANLATSYFKSISYRKYMDLKNVPLKVSMRNQDDNKTVEYHVNKLTKSSVASSELEARFMIIDVLRGLEPSTKMEISKRLANMDEYLHNPRKKLSRTK